MSQERIAELERKLAQATAEAAVLLDARKHLQGALDGKRGVLITLKGWEKFCIESANPAPLATALLAELAAAKAKQRTPHTIETCYFCGAVADDTVCLKWKEHADKECPMGRTQLRSQETGQ